MTGALSGTTVTLKEQSAPPPAEQLTTVVPTWNVEPDGGLQVTGPQVPLVVGLG
jgi:hypothetical protein